MQVSNKQTAEDGVVATQKNHYYIGKRVFFLREESKLRWPGRVVDEMRSRNGEVTYTVKCYDERMGRFQQGLLPRRMELLTIEKITSEIAKTQ